MVGSESEKKLLQEAFKVERGLSLCSLSLPPSFSVVKVVPLPVKQPRPSVGLLSKAVQLCFGECWSCGISAICLLRQCHIVF